MARAYVGAARGGAVQREAADGVGLRSWTVPDHDLTSYRTATSAVETSRSWWTRTRDYVGQVMQSDRETWIVADTMARPSDVFPGGDAATAERLTAGDDVYWLAREPTAEHVRRVASRRLGRRRHGFAVANGSAVRPRDRGGTARHRRGGVARRPRVRRTPSSSTKGRRDKPQRRIWNLVRSQAGQRHESSSAAHRR